MRAITQGKGAYAREQAIRQPVTAQLRLAVFFLSRLPLPVAVRRSPAPEIRRITVQGEGERDSA
jgi:hypothetical protein